MIFFTSRREREDSVYALRAGQAAVQKLREVSDAIPAGNPAVHVLTGEELSFLLEVAWSAEGDLSSGQAERSRSLRRTLPYRVLRLVP